MPLLERTAEMGTLSALIREAEAGTGRVALIEGSPGIGKSELVTTACSLARDAGFEVLDARGNELEAEFAFGIVGQLFEARIAKTDPARRAELFAGAASLTAPLLGAGSAQATTDPASGDPFPIVHGLYWLTTGLASDAPLVLAVDDAHWSDEASLRWLHYMARRVEDLPIFIVLAARSTEPEAPVATIEAIRAEPGVRLIRPSTLSTDAAGLVLAEIFDAEPSSSFVRACHQASGGNPFLLTELARSLAADGGRPEDAASFRIDSVPSGIASHTLIRLSQLPKAARAMALAVAVLGDGTEFREASTLAGLDESEASGATDALIASAFLAAERPLRFQHPLLRSAIYGDLRDADRRRRHKQAARVLFEHSAPPEQIAVHLLLSEPGKEEWVVDSLSRAATTTMARGAPAAAVRYLRRALAEHVPERRAELLFALGSAEGHLLDEAGIEHLREALALGDTPAQRVAVARVLAFSLVRLARVPEAIAALAGEATALPEDAVEARLELDADIAAMLLWGTDDSVEALDATLARVPDDLDPSHAAQRTLLTCRAYRGTRSERPADEVAAMAREALDAGLIDDPGPASPQWSGAIHTLVATDDSDAQRWAEQGLRRSHASGSLFGVALNANLLSIRALHDGATADSEAYGWEALHAARELQIEFGLPVTLGGLINALIERNKADVAWDEVVASGYETEIPPLLTGAILAESRGRLRMSLGDVEAGLADLLDAGRRFERGGVTGPGISSWRSHAAEAHVLLGDRREAGRLAEADLEAARRFGRPRPIGIALRASSLALEGDEAIERLHEAVTCLAPSAARLEHARALCDLGAALRRAKRRREARTALASAVDGASRCGALALAERGTEELRATGARPRRLLLSGIESLTASELRVARLAAEGMSNREIAQTLFVTTKTVEKHLSSSYGKLEIGSRDELPGALAPTEGAKE